jgi:amino acid transporter
MAVPDMGAAYLLVVAAAIFVCCLAIQASTIRLCFSMSRDEQLPGSSLLRKVHPRLHTPIGSCIAIGVLAFIPMLQYTGAAIVAIAATGMILSIIHISEPTRPEPFSYGVFCL